MEETKSLTSLKADRRQTRQMSRQRDRFTRRQHNLVRALIAYGFWPSDSGARKVLASQIDPWDVRLRAVSEKVSKEEFGRALFHINQRRGFKSNRLQDDSDKDSKESAKKENKKGDKSDKEAEEKSALKGAIAKTKEEIKISGLQTIGAFLALRHQRGGNVRGDDSSGKKNTYEILLEREMMEQEFDLVWKKQACLDEEFYTDEKRDELKKIIFHQRPLKPVQPGKCQHLHENRRAPKALPSVQRFRIYQEINNLSWMDENGYHERITKYPDVIDTLYERLEHKQKSVSISQMKKLKWRRD